MTRERYEELLGKLLDDELLSAEATELVKGLREYSELLRDLRQHLVLWDVWSQHVAEERSAESFLAAWKTRVRAEMEVEKFSESVMERIRKAGDGFKFNIGFWKRWRPVQIAFAIFALAFLAVAGWWAQQKFLKSETSQSGEWPEYRPCTNRVVTVTGEGVCMCCVFHQGPPQRPAIRVKHGGASTLIFLEFPGYTPAMHRYFTGGTTITAKGILKKDGDRLVLTTQSIKINGVQYR